jgi:hypothetical protein
MSLVIDQSEPTPLDLLLQFTVLLVQIVEHLALPLVHPISERGDDDVQRVVLGPDGP